MIAKYHSQRGHALKSLHGCPCTVVWPGSDYSDEEIVWLKAMSEYQQRNHRAYPEPGEILAVARAVGYRRLS